VRRGRLTSWVILIALLLTVLALPVGFESPNHVLLALLWMVVIIQVSAFFCNRLGQVSMAGFLITASSEVGLMAAILTSPNGMDVNSLPLLDLLVQPLLFTVSTARKPAWVFVVAFVNSAFFAALFFLLPIMHTAALMHLLNTQGIDTVLRPMTMELVVAVVTFLGYSSYARALKTADREEEMIKQQQDRLEYERRKGEEKRHLERDISNLVAVWQAVANGEQQMILPRIESPGLQPLSFSLNVLLTRVQQGSRAEQELAHTRQVAEQVANMIQRRNEHISIPPTGTCIDIVALALLADQRSDQHHLLLRQRTPGSHLNTSEGG
jgi:hypothetical protein